MQNIVLTVIATNVIILIIYKLYTARIYNIQCEKTAITRGAAQKPKQQQNLNLNSPQTQHTSNENKQRMQTYMCTMM